MYRIFTLFLFSISLTLSAQEPGGLTGKVTGLNLQSVSQGCVVRFNCSRTSTTANQPLLIVQGRKRALSSLSSFNPNDIASVKILKSAEAFALFGSEGMNGVIVVEMKRNPFSTIIITDAIDQTPVRYATATFLFPGENDTLRYVADSIGRVETNSAMELSGKKMIVSAAGYKTREMIWDPSFDYSEGIISLERDEITCEEAVVKATGFTRSACYSMGCRNFIVCSTSIVRNNKVSEAVNDERISVYPNPAVRGGQITLKVESINNRATVSLLSLAGAVISSQYFDLSKTNGRISLQIPATLASGMYFLRISYENGQSPASAKVIIR